jgi:hypothetical protein
MNPIVKKFIEDNIELIDNSKFRELYCKAFVDLKYRQILELDDVLLSADVTRSKHSDYFPIRFLVLCGASNTGKTYTLKRLIQLLLADPSFRLLDCCNDFYSKLYDYKRKPGKDMPDVWAIFCHKGTHIVVTTRGDSPSVTVNEFERHKLGCDIFVCACHNTARSVNTLKNYLGAANDDFVAKITVANPDDEQSWMPADDIQAEDLLNKIKKLI